MASRPPRPPQPTNVRMELHSVQMSFHRVEQQRRSVVEENCKILRENKELKGRNEAQAEEIERLKACVAKMEKRSPLKTPRREYKRLPMKAGPVDVRKGKEWVFDFGVGDSFPGFVLSEEREVPVMSWQGVGDLEQLRRLGRVQGECLREHVWDLERVCKVEIEVPDEEGEGDDVVREDQRVEEGEAKEGEMEEKMFEEQEKMETDEVSAAPSSEALGDSEIEGQDGSAANNVQNFEGGKVESDTKASILRDVDPKRPFAAFTRLKVEQEDDTEVDTPQSEEAEENAEVNEQVQRDQETDRDPTVVDFVEPTNDVVMEEESAASVATKPVGTQTNYTYGTKRSFVEVEGGDVPRPFHNPDAVKCFRCHGSKMECNLEAQCQNCQHADVDCRRATCWRGSNCGRRECNFLHPGQWPRGDENWTIVYTKPRLYVAHKMKHKRARTTFERGEYDAYRP